MKNPVAPGFFIQCKGLLILFNNVFFGSVLMLALVIGALGFYNIPIVMFVLAEGIVHFLRNCGSLFNLHFCLSKTYTAYCKAHSQEQHNSFHKFLYNN